MHMKAPAVIKQKTKQKNSTDIILQILHYIDSILKCIIHQHFHSYSGKTEISYYKNCTYIINRYILYTFTMHEAEIISLFKNVTIFISTSREPVKAKLPSGKTCAAPVNSRVPMHT